MTAGRAAFLGKVVEKGSTTIRNKINFKIELLESLAVDLDERFIPKIYLSKVSSCKELDQFYYFTIPKD